MINTKFMKKVFAICIVFCMIFLSACGNESNDENKGADSKITVTDEIGRTIEVIPGSYKRVVCIGAGALRMYSYIGDINLLCGVEDIDNITLSERPKMFDSVARPYVLAYADIFSLLPSCGVGGPNAQSAEAEKILSCNPDLVISAYEDYEKTEALQKQLGIPVIVLRSGSDGIFSDAFDESIRLLGEVLDRNERADEFLSFKKQELADIFDRIKNSNIDKKVYICGLGNWGTTDHLMSSFNYKPFEFLNIDNVLVGDEKGVVPIDEEYFLSISNDIDIMIVDAAAIKNIIPLYAEKPDMFDTVKAWREKEVYLEMPYNAYYTNFELSLSNVWFTAKAIYPEQFLDVDINEKIKDITEMFLGKDLTEEINNCPFSYGGYQKIDPDNFLSNYTL